MVKPNIADAYAGLRIVTLCMTGNRPEIYGFSILPRSSALVAISRYKLILTAKP